MPYKNIVWIKLRLELLQDYRFIRQLNERQKLLYLGLLLLAGASNNAITNDPQYIAWSLNIIATPEEITKDIDHICKIYPKLLLNNGVLSFAKFEEFHNMTFGSSQGVPRDKLGSCQIKIKKKIKIKRREDKEIHTNTPIKEELKPKDQSPTREAQEFFYACFKDAVGTEYAINWGKDGEIMKEILPTTPMPELKDLIRQYFISKDPWILEKGYTTGMFKVKINNLKHEISKTAKATEHKKLIQGGL